MTPLWCMRSGAEQELPASDGAHTRQPWLWKRHPKADSHHLSAAIPEVGNVSGAQLSASSTGLGSCPGSHAHTVALRGWQVSEGHLDSPPRACPAGCLGALPPASEDKPRETGILPAPAYVPLINVLLANERPKISQTPGAGKQTSPPGKRS